jgi:uncharacterized phiE125 gp8 family phage protein
MPIIYSKVSVEPTVEPITLVEAKLHLRVDHSEEDDIINILRQAAREIVELHTNRSLITQTRVIKLDNFPYFDTIKLTYGPVLTLTSITYDDDDDANQTLASSLYWTDLDSNIARIVVKDSWPSTYDKPNAVQITYDAGYGATGADVPAPLKQAMFLILAHLYENRQQVIVSGSPTGALEIPFGASVLMNTYVLEQSVMY